MLHVQVRDLTPALWPSVETLFGKNGASGGCWCMFWRLKASEPYARLKGQTLKRRFKSRVAKGAIRGALAFADGEPVGWVTYGERMDFPRLERSRSLACDDKSRVWSVPCFFVEAGFRRQGVASQLLSYALDRMRRAGAPAAEGYPVKPKPDGSPLPASFSYTGTVAMFEKAGFLLTAPSLYAKVRMRCPLGAGEAPG
ncbi:MAG: GNAT family N-acetyltransferase [Myxococcaceae bacterium]